MVSAYDVPQQQKVDESSLVVLLIQNNERRRVVKRYFERLGIKVSVVRHSEHFQDHIKSMLVTQSQNSTTDRTSSQSDYMSTGRSVKLKYGKKEVPLSSLDGIDDHGGAYSMKKNKGAPTFFLCLIDVSAGQYEQTTTVMENFHQEFSNNLKSKVVWLENPTIGCSGLLVERMKLGDDAIIMSKPLHGSRLHQVVRVLPGFGGISSPLENYDHVENVTKQRSEGKSIAFSTSEIQGECCSDGEAILSIREREFRVVKGGDDDMQFALSGLRILVAEDTPCKNLQRVGAGDVRVVVNGKEALELVLQGLIEPAGCSKRVLPIDLILMDCEMPIMSGFEATREIRKAEKAYAVHIRIIALTAHISPEKIKETQVVGMDRYMPKPPNMETLVKATIRVKS